MDLRGRLSNPPELAGDPSERGLHSLGRPDQDPGTAPSQGCEGPAEGPRHQTGRLSNPAQRRLTPTDIDDLIAVYQAGATIRQLAYDFDIHRSTVAAHLDRRQIPRREAKTAGDDTTLAEAAESYATGSSLADVARRYGIDPQTVANRFQRAGVPVRPRRGWGPAVETEVLRADAAR